MMLIKRVIKGASPLARLLLGNEAHSIRLMVVQAHGKKLVSLIRRLRLSAAEKGVSDESGSE